LLISEKRKPALYIGSPVVLLPQYRSFAEAQACHQAALNAKDKSQKTYWALMAAWQEPAANRLELKTKSAAVA
jgi:hypothetical protein